MRRDLHRSSHPRNWNPAIWSGFTGTATSLAVGGQSTLLSLIGALAAVAICVLSVLVSLAPDGK